MSAASSFRPATAAALFAGLMAVAPASWSDGAQHNGWRDGSDSSRYLPEIRGDNGRHTGWYKKDKKKKGPRNGTVTVPEPPMIVLFGTGLLVLGVIAWRTRRSR
jgi:hypothetical protein